MPIIHIHSRNRSRYPVNHVWENAQDLEHVAFLHRRTNRFFQLLHAWAPPGSPYAYEVMVYRAKRRALGVFSLQSFGFRQIVAPRNIWQVEHIPALGVTSALNSMLKETGDPEFPTLMHDEVVMEVPEWLYALRGWVERSLLRHAKIQCAEDEPFRERRVELENRGIRLPFSVFNLSAYQHLTSRFSANLSSA